MKNINSLLEGFVTSKNTPSIQYAIFDKNGTIYSYRNGFKDIGTRVPIDVHSTYNLFSITKTVTAIAILQMAQSGLIRLTDPVTQFLPDLPFDRRITIMQLLNHSSGIANPIPLRWTHLRQEHEGFDRRASNREIYNKWSKPRSEPGKEFHYSNIGYLILGDLVETLTGQSFDSYVKENIFDKISISSNQLSFVIDERLHATGYQKRWTLINALLGIMIDKKKLMEQSINGWKPFKPFYINGMSYGGMIGSCEGLIKYAQALLSDDSPLLDETHKQILFRETLIGNTLTGMSLSWFTGILKGNRFYTHAGGGGGYYSEIRVYPGLGIGSVLLLNRSGMKDARMLDKFDSFFIKGSDKYVPG